MCRPYEHRLRCIEPTKSFGQDLLLALFGDLINLFLYDRGETIRGTLAAMPVRECQVDPHPDGRRKYDFSKSVAVYAHHRGTVLGELWIGKPPALNLVMERNAINSREVADEKAGAAILQYIWSIYKPPFAIIGTGSCPIPP